MASEGAEAKFQSTLAPLMEQLIDLVETFCSSHHLSHIYQWLTP